MNIRHEYGKDKAKTSLTFAFVRPIIYTLDRLAGKNVDVYERCKTMILKQKIAIFLAVWFVINLLSAFGLVGGLWGIHLLMFFPVWARVLFLVLIASLFLSRVRDGAMRSAEWVAHWVPRWLRPVLLGVFAGGAFYVFRTATHLLGDGALLLRELEIADVGPLHRTDRAPLVFYLFEQLKGLGQPAEMTHRIYSWVAGVFYVVLAPVAASTIGRDRGERIVALGLLLTLGCVLYFFGYVETYALLLPVGLAYLIFGVRAVQNGGLPYYPALLLGVLIPLHMIHAMLIPSLLILAWGCEQRVKAVGISLGLVTLVSCGLLWLSGIPPWLIFSQAGEAPFLGLWTDFHRPYGIISFGHVLDVLNQYLLIAPAAVGILFLCGRKLKPNNSTTLFLMFAAAFPVLFTLLANAKIGAFRDWDVMGLASLPLMFWCAWIFVRHNNVRSDGIALVGVAAIQLMLWVGVNADRRMSEARFDTTLRASHLSPYARSYGWETLGGYYRSQNRLTLALDAYSQALKADPNHPRHWNAAGNLYRRMGNPQEASRHFQRAIEIAPNFAGAHSNLGNALNQLGRYQEAVAAYKHALTLDATLTEAHTNLGVAYHGLGQYEAAVAHHTEALKRKKNFVDALSNLGNTYNSMGRHKAALSVLLQAIKNAPGHAFAHANMGNAYLGLQQYNAALEHLDMALALQPNLIAALFNQGIAMMGLQRFEESVAVFQKVVQLSPALAKAYHSMGVAYEQLGQVEQVRACYEKVLELEPNYPHAALILSWLQKNSLTK
ncbi:MAG: tetratricopeptide repeat protein [Candidatus Latescibacteria bacterium]|nr:tetratricopeptide repeat protein [Candidatus Latescibacterota bacterium]